MFCNTSNSNKMKHLDDSNIQTINTHKNILLDFELEEADRINAFISIYNIDQDTSFELLKRLCSMYQFSGSRIIERFLFKTGEIKISPIFKYESVLALLLFKEPTIDVKDKDDILEISNRNEDRSKKAYECLYNLFLTNEHEDALEFQIQCKIEATFLLMESKYHTNQADSLFKKIINNTNLNSEYRYKTILSLENKKDTIKEAEFFAKNALLEFVKNKENSIYTIILASQNLLQNFKFDDERKQIEDRLLIIAESNKIEYNLRADACDVILNLGSDDSKSLGRIIIDKLGWDKGVIKTVYENKQNVHTSSIEKSIFPIVRFLSTYPTSKPPFGPRAVSVSGKVDGGTLYYSCVAEQIRLLVITKEIDIDKVELSLKRIDFDRALYNTVRLSDILIRLWAYIHSSPHKDEMLNRLIEELEEMSGTCSSGFIGRLANVISGFEETLKVTISFEDQLVANFAGRLNAAAHKICEHGSIFYGDKLYDVIELYLNSNPKVLNLVKKLLMKTNHITDLPRMVRIINKYLETDRESKIKECVEEFETNVLYEMTIDNDKYAKRQNFLLFFRSYLSILREELYNEFKEFMNDSIFDLTIRRAISGYEGIDFMC